MKKVLALVLASAMALGMAATTFAASPPKATAFSGAGLEEGYNTHLGYSRATSGTGTMSNNTVTYDHDITPHAEEVDYINLFRSMFNGENGFDGQVDAVMSSKEISDSKFTVRTSLSSGSKAVKDVTIQKKDGRIKVEYATEWVNTGSLDFDFTVYLTIDGKRQNDFGLSFSGTLANEVTEVDTDDDYVDLSDGQVAEALDFVKDIEVELGNGVFIYTKMFKSKKYYGTASRDDDAEADVVYAKYPDVDNVVILKTVGLNSTGDIVKLDTDYSNYFVYDKDMNYLGQSNTLLPYSTRYYLANKKLDVTSDNDAEEDDGTAPETDDKDDGLNPETGGDDGIDNANANPGTGR